MEPELEKKRELMEPELPDAVTSGSTPQSASGVPAPPLESSDLDRLFPYGAGEDDADDGRKKKKQQTRGIISMALFVLAALALMALGLAMAIATQVATTTEGYNVAVTVASRMGERYDVPDQMPLDAELVGALNENWQQGELQQLQWHSWLIDVTAGDQFTFFVRSLNDVDVLPIIGVYDSAGRKQISANVRSAEDKDITFLFNTTGKYWLLVGSIGGVAGKYEVRAQKQP
ncbi:MAG: hypothetical protein KF726_13755 [Anaerolineae bacterium]|nr:hypothetical protein [Anaerolineae bacterium]